jgi:hypothetical protein
MKKASYRFGGENFVAPENVHEGELLFEDGQSLTNANAGPGPEGHPRNLPDCRRAGLVQPT